MIGLPWLDYPTEYDTDSYTSVVRNAAQTNWTDFLEELRGKYPNVTIIDNPYGLSVVELRILQSAGSVPDVTAMTGLAATSLFTDYKGHGGDILKDTASLVWLDRIYQPRGMWRPCHRRPVHRVHDRRLLGRGVSFGRLRCRECLRE